MLWTVKQATDDDNIFGENYMHKRGRNYNGTMFAALASYQHPPRSTGRSTQQWVQKGQATSKIQYDMAVFSVFTYQFTYTDVLHLHFNDAIEFLFSCNKVAIIIGYKRSIEGNLQRYPDPSSKIRIHFEISIVRSEQDGVDSNDDGFLCSFWCGIYSMIFPT